MYFHESFTALSILLSITIACPARAIEYNEVKRFSARTNQMNVASSGGSQRPILDRDTGAGLTFEEDKPRIDQFAEDMKNPPISRAYIIAYGGLVSPINEAKKRLMHSKPLGAHSWYRTFAFDND